MRNDTAMKAMTRTIVRHGKGSCLRQINIVVVENYGVFAAIKFDGRYVSGEMETLMCSMPADFPRFAVKVEDENYKWCNSKLLER